MKQRYQLKRFLVRIRRQFRQLQHSNSGEWAWLRSKPLPLASLNRNLWRTANPSLTFYTLLALSVIIATLGLLANSSATIIGAMIVAPLMGPILGVAFSIVLANRRLLYRSTLSLISGTILSIALAILVARIVGIETLTPEIQARVRPTLIDLGVALVAGTAGAYAKSRRDVADALPGVAIAVALVPPLGVVGIGIAVNSQPVATGALLLFMTNLVGIIFSGALVFLMFRYGSIARAQKGLAISVAALILLAIPLGVSFQDLLVKERIRAEINQLLRRKTLTFADRDIRSLNVYRRGRELVVDLEAVARPNTITERQVELVQDFLQNALGTTLTLNVQIIPVEQFTVPGR